MIKWKLITQLSVFGLIMAFASVSVISTKMEPPFWLMTFIFSAFVIARVAPGKYFLHGFILAMFNSVWITLVHLYFYDSYAANHQDMMSMYGTHPRLMMLLLGPLFGVMFGIILGLFALIASKVVKKNEEV
ncbi:hypothetical protein [Mucilaginibacter antarcticus]|uniref:Uncharacterized protein n=1 Tax=Mucilaginibacter antarcticus TaxID=1855725 RepID=A0ABW5XJ43_9SPHI